MARGQVIIREFDATSPVFVRTWKALPREVQAQAIEAFKALAKPPEERPASLHFHKMQGYDNIYSLHISKDDRYKASLKMEGDVAVMRRCGTHEEIDKNPE
jgi:hypothetical protein